MPRASKLAAAEVVLTAQECRCARAALGWSKQGLAHRSRVSMWTISRFENGHSRFLPGTAYQIVEALRDGGVLIDRENGFSIIKINMSNPKRPIQARRSKSAASVSETV